MFKKPQDCFPKWLLCFTLPSRARENFWFSISTTAFAIACISEEGHSDLGDKEW